MQGIRQEASRRGINDENFDRLDDYDRLYWEADDWADQFVPKVLAFLEAEGKRQEAARAVTAGES